MKTEDKIIFSIASVCIVVVISLWFRYSHLLTGNTPKSNPPAAIPIPSTRTTPSQKKDWIVYRNNLFGLSYPPELSFKYDNIQKGQNSFAGSLLLQNFDAYKRVPTFPGIFQLALFVEPDTSKSLEDLAKSEKTKSTKIISIDGNDALRGTSAKPSGDSPTVWMKKDGNLYTFQLPMPKSTNAQWFDEIISTFTFIK